MSGEDTTQTQGTETQEGQVSEEELEKSFNAAMENLKKSNQSSGSLQKSKNTSDPSTDTKAPMDDAGEEDDDDSDDDDDDGDYGSTKKSKGEARKSVQDRLIGDDDPQVSNAMDVEPFLRKLVKSIDDRISEEMGTIRKSMGHTMEMLKAQGQMLEVSANLQKSSHDTVNAIAKEPQNVKGRIQKSGDRFQDQEGDTPNVDPWVVLQKSSQWVKDNKLNIEDAGRLEYRVNKGLLFKNGDKFDQNIESLLKAEQG